MTGSVLLATSVGLADVGAVLAPIVLVAGGVLLLLLETATHSESRAHLPWVTALVAVVAAASAFWGAGDTTTAFGGSLAVDAFSRFFTVVICGSLALSALGAQIYLQDRKLARGEFYGLATLSASGMVMLTMAADLLVLFVSLEVMSIAIYALVAFRRDQQRSVEAAFKYLVLGAFSSALFLYGVALLYVDTGHLDLAGIAAGARGEVSGLFLTGAGLAAVGFAFKIAAVPFHMWTPDVYEGAPTPTTAFMAAGVKAAAFAAFLRLLLVALPAPSISVGDGGWGQILYVLALLTVVLGNALALVQDNVKRMLAYSSIAHAGYALLAVVAAAWGGPALTSSVLFYLLVYAATSIGAFAVVGAVEKKRSEGQQATGHIDEVAGLASKHPALAFAMTVFMLSLAGVPPTGGFIAKLDIFRALFQTAAHSETMQRPLYILAVISILASVLGAYYYLRVVVYMYMKPAVEQAEEGAAPRRFGAAFGTGLVIATLAVLLLGLWPAKVSSFAQDSVRSTFKTGPHPVAVVQR
ncbi:MAG: NADH-quinone oxidoreductase subunit N [Deltaproteobacteria bacterium]|nr:NADH-quinone oxidoreductase subunit N [Deltaproteobacteria bacterium]